MEFLKELHRRNRLFFYAGFLFLTLFILLIANFQLCKYSLELICPWLKPSKFAFSFAVYVFTLAWYMEYLKPIWSDRKVQILSLLITLLTFTEMTGILFQSWLIADSTYQALIPVSVREAILREIYPFGNAIITVNTLITVYIGSAFFRDIPLKPLSYLWSIRAAFCIFLLSALLGGWLIDKYGQVPLNKSHFGIPFTQFHSKRDILISLHFLGIHSLQLLPVCGYYLQSKMTKSYIISAIGIYVFLCTLVLLKA